MHRSSAGFCPGIAVAFANFQHLTDPVHSLPTPVPALAAKNAWLPKHLIDLRNSRLAVAQTSWDVNYFAPYRPLSVTI